MSEQTWSEQRPPDDRYQVLDPDGELAGEPPDLDDDELLELYRTFVATRTFEDKMLSMQRSGEITLVARSRGEEATPLGSAAALSEGDWAFPTYRQKAAMLYWGMSMAEIVASHMGISPETIDEHLDADEPGVTFPADYTPIGVNVTNAVGAAMADQYDDTGTVSLAWVGDGGTSQGSFHEGMNFAGVFEPPAVIVCQNNQWAISEPSHRQTGSETFARKAEAYGIPHERVDGNDVFAVYEKTSEAVERARDGDGPTFIECVTYRMGNHNTSDNADLYRDEAEQKEYWAERDPVNRYETYLRDEGVLDSDRIEEIESEVESAVSDAVERARDVPDPDPERMFDHQLHEDTWKQEHQRVELGRERDGRNPFTDFDGEGFDER